MTEQNVNILLGEERSDFQQGLNVVLTMQQNLERGRNSFNDVVFLSLKAVKIFKWIQKFGINMLSPYSGLKTKRFVKTLLSAYESARLQNPEQHYHPPHRLENLRSHTHTHTENNTTCSSLMSMLLRKRCYKVDRNTFSKVLTKQSTQT
jgi:hypothetical protein